MAEEVAIDQLFDLTYHELRRLAAKVRGGDRSATLTPTALVNEAWIKLSASPDLAPVSKLHFLRLAARAMRQVLVEAARRRNAHKRGGQGDVLFVTLDESRDAPIPCGEEFLALDQALDELALLEPRQAKIVESRFFGGLDVQQTAALLEVSEATILRDWRVAKAWLARELHQRR